MSSVLTFRISLAVVGLPIYAIRDYYLGLIVKSGDRIAKGASETTVLLVWLVSVLATVVPVAYVVAPRWLEWAALPLPAGLQWLGAALGILSIPLLLWAHRALGRNFNLPDGFQERQSLVTGGPYRRVRHPMYTTFALFAWAAFLLSANWFVGSVLLGYCRLAFAMAGQEEALLIEKFGQPYRQYMQHTGRCLPRLRE